MTSHKTALEASAKALSGHIGGVCCHKTGGVGSSDCECRDIAAEAISAYISTLSPDVSGLVERLRKDIAVDPNVALTPVDRLRLLAFVDSEDSIASFDADDAEYIVEGLEAMADALTALSLQLAAVEKERDSYAQHSVENSMRAFNWMAAHDALKAGVPYEYPSPADVPNIVVRAETAEASLTLAQEENERLRKVLAFYRDQWEQEVDAKQTGAGWTGSIGDVIPTVALCEDKGTIARAALSTPSKGKDKT